MSNVYYINPDFDILTNLLDFIGNFAVQNICSRFSPFEAAQEFVEKGHFDYQKMLSFEDITWDTVFAKMKTVDFSSVHNESDQEPHDMKFYMSYTDMIHEMDSDELVKQFGDMSIEVSGWICLEIWEALKEQVIPVISGEADINDMLRVLKTKIAPIIIESIKQYYEGDPSEIADELKDLFDQTQEVFAKIEHDETAFFKVIYASLVKGTEVMICNPEYLQLGDRIKSAVKYYASGISVTIGDRLAAQIKPSRFALIEKYAPGVIEYIPTLISMVVTCAIVISVDKNPLLIALTNEFNKVPTITGNIALYRENALAFEQMAANLAQIDLDELKRIIEGYDHLVGKMKAVTEPQELNRILMEYYKENKRELPWGNRSLEEHWADKSSRLVFK